MLITRTNPYTGKPRSIDMNISQTQLNEYNNGKSAQHAFPNLSANEREFIISGITGEEFDALFKNNG